MKNNKHNLEQFIGTEAYYSMKPISHLNVTDGVKFVADHGGYWFVSDTCVAITHKPKLRNEGFLAVELIVDGINAKVEITDGNENVLDTSNYSHVDGFDDGRYVFFVYGNVMMLASEY